MPRLWTKLAVPLIVVAALADLSLAQFVVFPKAEELVSPDKRFVVHNEDPEARASDFVGTFHSLWLTDLSTGRSHKLCDYMGPTAVAWSGDDFLVVTQYLGRKTSRAIVLSAAHPADALTLDQPLLTNLLPVELRPVLRENDHVFIEASKVEHQTLLLTVWGYGAHNPNGFHWRCTYALREGTASCAAGEQR
ncbi:MAG TPA: hypothetical protein VMX38_09010 [Verrucomicrobiae bacterium]|jgi:hypothetical protein|nr:hypothetical protein [Verrucomicrobiae bacterium]